MKRNRVRHIQNVDETAELTSRLEEDEEALHAIQQYMVDAFVVNCENGIQVVTLNESESPYRMMIEAMNEGAVTLVLDGIKFYCNSCFGDTVHMDGEKLVGRCFHKLIVPEEQSRFKVVARKVEKNNIREEFYLQAVMGEGAQAQRVYCGWRPHISNPCAFSSA